MSEFPDSGRGGPERAADNQREEDLAGLLATLEKDSFIPVAALNVVAEILTYLHGKDGETAAAESEF